MSEGTRLAAARKREEATMQSTCRITRLILEESTDTREIDLTDTDPSNDVVLESPCKILDRSSRVFVLNTELQTLGEQTLVLFLPVATSGGLRPDDRVEILDGGPDPALTGERFLITGIPLTTRATARRFPVDHVA